MDLGCVVGLLVHLCKLSWVFGCLDYEEVWK